MSLPYDRQFYEEHLADFLPDTFIDCHTHIWIDAHNHFGEEITGRSCSWPNMVAKDNPVEDLNETNRLLFPGKRVLSVLYGQPMATIDLKKNNAYVARVPISTDTPPSTCLTLPSRRPWWSGKF